MNHETASKLRGLVRRVVLKNVNDDGETQTASVEVADGVWRDKVEIMQPYGFAASVPEDGATGLAFAVGGDEGDIVLVALANPSARMGGLKPGEVGLYNQHGDKVVLGADGKLIITAGTSIIIVVDGVSFELSASGINIIGGKITHDEKNIGSTHVHGGILPGGAKTDTPS